MSVSDDLIAVRTVLARCGRAKGEFMDDEGRICLAKAAKTIRGSTFRSQPVQAMFEALAPHLPSETNPRYIEGHSREMSLVVSFNDKPTTTDQDVFDVLDKAIANQGGMA